MNNLTFNTADFKLRTAENGEGMPTIEGYACKWNTRSINFMPVSQERELYEVMDKGCITQELVNRSHVVLTTEHNPNNLLGSWQNGEGSLSLNVDEVGLYCRCQLADTTIARETVTMMQRGDLRYMSFQFMEGAEDDAVKYERTAQKSAEGKEVWLRHVRSVGKLIDVTICAQPCYYSSEVHLRDANNAITAITDAEKRTAEAEEAEKRAQEEAAERAARDKFRQDMNNAIEVAKLAL